MALVSPTTRAHNASAMIRGEGPDLLCRLRPCAARFIQEAPVTHTRDRRPFAPARAIGGAVRAGHRRLPRLRAGLPPEQQAL